ncbi:guanine nucleotide exchange factor synembryn [Fusarium denticulatum]|uniref:Guanine nucleotide exchange factor synembryn n=1 Tax=Fusarium denticulatum TaxID=48507 RepID=A0A8H5XLU8_9HYPO|nr:guanine nucleotide exchange factor synembryn [Fusarium denticulatum]
MAAQPAFGLPTGAQKLKDVTELVEALTEDLEEDQFLPDDRALALEKLKLYSRDPRNAEPLFSEAGFTMLLRHAYDKPSTNSARAALKVIANLMLLVPPTRHMFVDKGFAPKAIKELDTGNYDDEFLNSRILFLTTYETKIDLKELLDKDKLADRIINNLAKHAKEMDTKAKADPMQDMALTETVKLLFNVTHWCTEKASLFNPAVPHLIAVLFKADVSQTKPLDPPVGFIINGFLNLDLNTPENQEALHPKGDPERVVSRVIDILDVSIRTIPDNQKDASIVPVLGLVRSIYEHAPDSTKAFIREKLLPTEEERKDVLGKGHSLSAKLLQNSNNAIAPSLRNLIQHVLFELSDKDASKFVENVGYGFASGFLFQNNIPIPASVAEAHGAGEAAKEQKPVNPITGQFVDAEKPVDEPEMTEEEKEREAERLFVLFERLKKTGIIDVQNPVETALREGRFRELRDDEVEELE